MNKINIKSNKLTILNKIYFLAKQKRSILNINNNQINYNKIMILRCFLV